MVILPIYYTRTIVYYYLYFENYTIVVHRIYTIEVYSIVQYMYILLYTSTSICTYVLCTISNRKGFLIRNSIYHESKVRAYASIQYYTIATTYNLLLQIFFCKPRFSSSSSSLSPGERSNFPNVLCATSAGLTYDIPFQLDSIQAALVIIQLSSSISILSNMLYYLRVCIYIYYYYYSKANESEGLDLIKSHVNCQKDLQRTEHSLSGSGDPLRMIFSPQIIEHLSSMDDYLYCSCFLF